MTDPFADEMSLLELADRLLNRGVVLTGEATISVAGVDLIYLGLNVVLTPSRTCTCVSLSAREAAAARVDDG